MSEFSTPQELNELSFLVARCLDGSISREETKRLETLLESKKELRDYYRKYVSIYCDLSGLLKIAQLDSPELEVCRDDGFWKSLADYEKTAPAVEIPKMAEEKKESISAEPPSARPPVSKLSLYSLLLSSAALFFLVVYAHFVSLRQGIEVATLTGSLNAKWLAAGSLDKGMRLSMGDQAFELREGYVEIVFDNQTRLTVEGPAKFQILADDRMGLTYGKVYTDVPAKAVGFSIYTPIAKIIDMGTEFGVEADSRGDTQVHVLKGKTVLLVGRHDRAVPVEVIGGQARCVSSSTQTVSEIPVRENYFVRSFDSSRNLVWRQSQRSLDLADIVRKGNGLGTGDSRVHLNYLKGFTTVHRGGETLIARGYLPIPDHPFIDGIFIPDKNAVVNSRGDVFDGFLQTNGVHCADLFGYPLPDYFYHDGQRRTVRFYGQEYSERGKACIFMPGSNHGITFDLDAIRKHYNLSIDRFTARVGIAAFDAKRCNANFYVLVDGQLRYSLLGYTEKGVLNDVSVKLEDTDRFLTLATSENVDPIDYMANSTLWENWCVFAEPVLVLKRIDSIER